MPKWYSDTLLSCWVTLLKLRAWQIGVKFVAKKDMPDDYGMTHRDREGKTALIELRQDADEETLVHELLHLAIDDMHSLADSMAMSLEDTDSWEDQIDLKAENICNVLASAMCALMRSSRRKRN